MRRRLKQILGIALVLAVLAGGWGVARDWVFWKRYFSVLVAGPLRPPVDWYQPTEIVPGGGGAPLPRASPGAGDPPAHILAQAAGWAGERNSDALIVLRDGRVIFEQYWGDGGPNAVFSSHSFHKTLLAMLVGVAIGEGHLSGTQQRAAAHIPPWRQDERRDITLEHLLHMASGLQPPDYRYHPWSNTIRAYLASDIIAEYLRLPLSSPPGREFGHYNANSQFLGLILERATGERYAHYLSRRLWRPLGAADARVWLDRRGGRAHSSCCLLATSEDWLKVGLLLLNDGLYKGRRLLPAGWVTAMKSPSAANPNYGYQLWLGSPYRRQRGYSPLRTDFSNFASQPYLSEQLFFLDGLGKQRLYIIPEARLLILRLGWDSPDWDDAWLPNLLLKNMPPSASPG